MATFDLNLLALFYSGRNRKVLNGRPASKLLPATSTYASVIA